MLNEDMQTLICNHACGMVATVNADGTPAVSPKGTFVVIDKATLAFGHIRSPGTVRNIAVRADVEVGFLDVLNRRAVRVSGTAEFIKKADAPDALVDAFKTTWAEYVPHMAGFVRIAVRKAELVTTPAYDIGYSEAELRAANLERLNGLA
ncbi:MAG: pyridoxamine 5'-phosphate oxidase family protein [Rhodospirillales bacterium]